MTTHLSRRGIAAAAGLATAAGLIGTAQAQTNESTFERVTRTKVLRIAALPGEVPYFQKDITTGEWRGAAISMAKDIAKIWDAQLEYVESTYAGSVLDLQSNKIDLAFALAPTPARALSIRFTNPFFVHPYGALTKKGFEPKTWSDINKPEIKVAVDIGSLHEVAARRYCPKAEIIAYKTRDEETLAFQGGKVDVFLSAAILGLSTVGKNPAMGPYRQLTGPIVALPSCLGLRREPDTRFQEVINAWIDFNRGTGQVREYIINGLELVGVKRDDIPAEVSF